LLRPGGHPPKVQEWYDKLAPVVLGAWEQLRAVKPGKLAMRTGCLREGDATLRVPFFWQDYLVRLAGQTVERAATGEEPSSFTKALILSYMVTADGTTPSKRWVGFRELPDGLFYAQAFRGYAENRLVRELGDGGIAALGRAAEELGGEPIEIGDAGYAFAVLPRIRIAPVYWLGDEDFPSRTSILFEDTAPHYMSTDGLAILGSRLVSTIAKAARA
jgi:hypothetical protein